MDRQIPGPVVLLATYGAGKSHLLSALASFLFAEVGYSSLEHTASNNSI
jgi:chromosomal replication initiation ATPase DnaA